MHKVLKSTYLVFVLPLMMGVGAPQSVWSQTKPPSVKTAPTTEQAQQNPAGKFVQDLGDKAIEVITDKSLTPEQRTEKYDDLLRNAFDLQTIGHFVVGRAWNSAAPEQREEYMQLFEKLVVKIYGDRLNFYSGESFHVKGVRSENDKDVMVNSEIDHPGGAQPTLVDWRVRKSGDKQAIVDVIVAGVSQSVTQRQEYASIIQSDGGKLDKLLKAMRERVQGTPHENSTRP